MPALSSIYIFYTMAAWGVYGIAKQARGEAAQREIIAEYLKNIFKVDARGQALYS